MKRLDIYIVIAVIVISIGLFLTFSLQSQENREVVMRLKLNSGIIELLLMQTEFELKKLIVQTMIV